MLILCITLVVSSIALSIQESISIQHSAQKIYPTSPKLRIRGVVFTKIDEQINNGIVLKLLSNRT